jgi:hypothetical protein
MDRSEEARRLILQALADLRAGRISAAQALDVDRVARAMMQQPLRAK